MSENKRGHGCYIEPSYFYTRGHVATFPVLPEGIHEVTLKDGTEKATIQMGGSVVLSWEVLRTGPAEVLNIPLEERVIKTLEARREPGLWRYLDLLRPYGGLTESL